MYLLHKAGGHPAQAALWLLRETGRLSLHDVGADEAVRMAALMAKYHDLPMDLADASLMAVAERLGTRRVFTLDRDFRVYRFADGAAVEVVPKVLTSANVGALTNGVLKAMLLTKLMKTTAAALVILGVLGAGVIGLAGQKPELQPPAKPSTQQAKKDKTPEQKAEQAKDDKEKDEPDIRYQDFSVSGRAVDPDGKPVSGATIFLVSTNSSPARLLDTVTTDKERPVYF